MHTNFKYTVSLDVNQYYFGVAYTAADVVPTINKIPLKGRNSGVSREGINKLSSSSSSSLIINYP